MPATTTFSPISRSALVRFGLLALVPAIALGAVLAHELNADIQQRYIDSAQSSATLITQVAIQPLFNAQQMSGGLSSADIAQTDAELQGAAVSTEVVRLKVWNKSGTIVYSDNHGLIARSFPIDDDLGGALAGKARANITSGHDAENAGDYLNGPLVQVYVPLVFKGDSSPSGAFELYLPYAPVQAAIDHESNQLYIVLAAGLALFYASLFPIVLLVDRWRRRLMQDAQEATLANLAVLERLNRAKSEFLTRVSHQFRTALVGIEGFSEVMRDSEHLDLNEVKEFASDIYNDAERLNRAFSEMVELEAMEAGRTAFEFAPVDVNQLIGAIVESTLALNPGQRLVTKLDPSVRTVSGDRDKMAQVLKILLSNAIKYSPAGSEVAVASQAEGDHVTVTVADHGPGMPSGSEPGLFPGATNGTKGSGTGLGLPIAYQIVEMHGGRLWFDSKAGQGSEFHFTLPVRVRPSRQLTAVARTQ